MKKVCTALCVLLLLAMLCGCSGDKAKGQELYQTFWEYGLFLYDKERNLELNTLMAEEYLPLMSYDGDINDCIDDINAYLKSIGEPPLSN